MDRDIERDKDRLYLGPNRTLCQVLDELRKCYESRNFAPMLGLIEEAQIMGNRMEAALVDQKDVRSMNKHRENMKRRYNEALKIIRDMEKQAGKRSHPAPTV